MYTTEISGADLNKIEKFIVLVGRAKHSVCTLAEASAVYRRHVEENDLGASQVNEGVILDVTGKKIARISYNGRVWAQ